VNPRVVAIDGAAGSGKSTLARALARSLGLPYVNTGLMYRGLTAAALRSGVEQEDERGLVSLLETVRFSLSGQNPPELVVEGYPEDALTSPAVEAAVHGEDLPLGQEIQVRLTNADLAQGALAFEVAEHNGCPELGWQLLQLGVQDRPQVGMIRDRL